MTWQSKLLIIVAIILVVIGFFWVKKWRDSILERHKETQTSLMEMKELSNKITRSESSYATPKDLDKFAKDLDIKLDEIKEDLNSLEADVKGVQKVTVISSGFSGKGIPSDSVEPRKNVENNGDPLNDKDPFKYQKSAQLLKLNEPFQDNAVPWGQVKFKAWQENPWDLDIYKRKYNVVNVLGQDEDGRHYVYNKFNIEVNGKKHDIKISSAEFVEEFPSSKFRFLPALYLGLDIGAYLKNPEFDFMPNLQVSLFSYGRTKISPEWTFLGLGLGYATNKNNINFMLSPVNYNVGRHIPLMNNTYVGPSISTDIEGNFIITGGIRVGL